MRVRKLPLKQQLFIDFLACFLIGIVLANLLGADSFQKNGNLTRYYLKQFQYADVQSQELLWHVGCNRLLLFLSLLALGTIPKGKLVHILFVERICLRLFLCDIDQCLWRERAVAVSSGFVSTVSCLCTGISWTGAAV